MNDKASSGATDTGKDNSSAGSDQGDTLDSLLSEYADGKKASEGSDKGPGNEVAALKEEVLALKSELGNISYQKAMGTKTDQFEVVPTLKGDIKIPDLAVESWVNARAQEDERLMDLWNNRSSNMSAFQEAIEKLQPEFEAFAEKEGFTKAEAGNDASSGDGSLVSAVRASRTSRSGDTGFDAVDWQGLSSEDFAMKGAELIRFVESGGKL